MFLSFATNSNPTADVDYTSLSALQVLFQPSPQTVQVQCTDISITDDSILEPNTEIFTILLESFEPLKVLVGIQEAVVNIEDDESKKWSIATRLW